MGLGSQGNILVLAGKLLDRKKSVEPFILTTPQKPPFGQKTQVEQPFCRATPESVGVSSSLISDFLCELQVSSSLDMHNVVIAKNSKIICEASFGGYDRGVWHAAHSQCKSVTSLAIGMLVDEGRLDLDEKIVKIFADNLPRLSAITHRHITVRHLLTMTSGVIFNEIGAVTEEDWVRKFFESSLKSEPGKKFQYNSMNSYILSAIVKKITGEGLCEYLRPRLFEPLGIKKYFWETCPRGIEKGGWGLYILPEDILKIAELVLAGGVWKGKRLISRRYIEAATSLQIETPESTGAYGYGYHIWVGEGERSFLFNGMFGQNIIAFKETGLLLLENAGNNEIFQQSTFFYIANEFFGRREFPDSLPENRRAQRLLRTILGELGKCRRYTKLGFFEKRKVKKTLACQMAALDGKRYVPLEAESATVGLLPLVTQVVQNNYTRGLENLEFNLQGGTFYLTVNERDESYVLPVGFFAPEYTDLVFHGEPWRVSVQGEFCETEDGVPVFKVRVSFLEAASARTIKIFFPGDKITVKFSENPGKGFFEVTLGAVRSSARANPITEALLSRADSDIVISKINGVIEPTLTLRCEQQ